MERRGWRQIDCASMERGRQMDEVSIHGESSGCDGVPASSFPPCPFVAADRPCGRLLGERRSGVSIEQLDPGPPNQCLFDP